MFKDIVKYGLLAGAIVAVPMIGLVLIWRDGPPNTTIGMAIGFTTMLVALSVVFIAVKRRRDVDQGGAIKFWPAFGLGLGISAVAGLVYVLAWEASLALTGMDYAAKYAETVVSEARARGESEAALAALAAKMEDFAAQYANPLFRMPVTFTEIFPVGVLVSLVSADLLRNPRFMPARR
jgi:hypothetical protein